MVTFVDYGTRGGPIVEATSLEDSTILITNRGANGRGLFSFPGDDDGLFAQDVDALYAGVANEAQIVELDHNQDGLVDEADIEFLFAEKLQTHRADLDLDGRVGFSDFLTLSGNFGTQTMRWSDGDIDGDGSVSFEDFLALSGAFGEML